MLEAELELLQKFKFLQTYRTIHEPFHKIHISISIIFSFSFLSKKIYMYIYLKETYI